MGLLDILQQYAGGASPSQGNVSDHFDPVSQQVSQQDLGQGIAAAFRSDATPAFGQSVGSLFGQSNPTQQAGVLNQLVQSLGAGALTGATGGILGRILGGGSPGSVPTITPQQTSQLSPGDVGAIATHAQQQNPSIVDEVGSFYAQHPTLVKTLGAVALSAVMGHLSGNR